MNDPVMELLRRQWQETRRWLEQEQVLDYADRPTGLGTWTVKDLVAHLGLGLGMVTDLKPAQPDDRPLSLARYVAAYPPAAESIAENTSILVAELGPDVLEGLDRIAEDAWAALEQITASVVIGRRGPISYSDFVMTRLLELVVHGDDLARTVPELATTPVLDDAAEIVSEALADVYAEAAGFPPDHAQQPLPWIRHATGRVPANDPYLPLL